MKIVIFAFLVIIFTQIQIASADEYIIHSGDHYSKPYKEFPFMGERIDISVRFDDSAKYDFTGDAIPDQQDTNKLFGFADCKGSHLQNSARLGWRYYQGQLEILGFTHRGGKFYVEPITAIQMNQIYRASISLSTDRRQYIYEFNGVKVSMDRGCQDEDAIGYYLYPYFGGNQTAPHDVTINVDEVSRTGSATIGLPYPNPIINYQVNFKASAFEDVQLYLKLYDMSGRTVWNSPRQQLMTSIDTPMNYGLPHSLASGMYLAMPVTVLSDGTELPAAIANQMEQKVLKIMVLH